MGFQIKAGLVVLVAAWVFFVVAKPLFLQFMTEEDFRLRRNAWLVVNAAAFASPSIWLYFGALAIVCTYTVKRDSSPAALFLFLLLAMAPYRAQIPTLGLIGQVFPLDHFRVLTIVLALPYVLRLQKQIGRRATNDTPMSAKTVDAAIVVFCLLQVLLTLPYLSATSVVRNMILLGLDVLLPYFFLSRAIRSVGQLREAIAALVMSVMVLAPLALFEMASTIMLWGSLQETWRVGMLYVVLLRDGLLRAQTTAGHSIVFGFACGMALVFWLALLDSVRGRLWRWGGTLLLCSALLASFSRGPWLGTVAGALVLLVAAPISSTRTLKLLGLGAAFGLALLVSPVGDRVLEYLPFIGEGDSGSITYRQRLLEISLLLIAESPFTGNPYFLAYMEDLRQGQGIIDLVNGLVTIALSYGVITLGAYLLAHGMIVWYGLRQLSRGEPSVRWLGAGLAGALVGALATLFTASNIHSIPYLILACTGLGVALIRVRVHGGSSVAAGYVTGFEDTVQVVRTRSDRRRAA